MPGPSIRFARRFSVFALPMRYVVEKRRKKDVALRWGFASGKIAGLQKCSMKLQISSAAKDSRHPKGFNRASGQPRWLFR